MPNGYASTNYPNGVTNAAPGTALVNYLAPDPSLVHQFFDDFDAFIAGAAGAATWTQTGTGTPATALVSGGDGGQLGQTTTTASGDSNILQLKATTFVITPGQDCWIKARFQLSNATNTGMFIGLISDATPFSAVTNGMYLQKAAASTTLTAKVTKASATSTFNVATLANSTFVNVGMHYTGTAIAVYFNNNLVGALPITNLPTAALNVTMAVNNGTAAANTMTVDYFFASTLRAASAQ